MLKRKSFRIHKTYGFQCEGCGCPLDPGEGRFCEDCQDERERAAKADRLAVPREPRIVL